MKTLSATIAIALAAYLGTALETKAEITQEEISEIRNELQKVSKPEPITWEGILASDIDHNYILPNMEFDYTISPVPFGTKKIPANTFIPVTIAASYEDGQTAPIVGIITQNIYATENRNLLIPRGSKIIGDAIFVYKGKFEIVWDRIISTNGNRYNAAGTPSTINLIGTSFQANQARIAVGTKVILVPGRDIWLEET